MIHASRDEPLPLVGLTRDGRAYHFAKNDTVLTEADLGRAEKSVAADDYRDSEFCGACWDPTGRTLFVNGTKYPSS